MKLSRHSALVILIVGFFFTGCVKDPVVEPIVVDAGVSQSIQLPDNSVTLKGTVTSGLTAGTTYLWTLVSGPGVPVFSNHDSATTNIKNLVAGTYILQFQATNNFGNVGLDTTSVVVNPAVAAAMDTLALQPANNPQEFDIEQVGGVDSGPGGASPEIGLWAWTKNGAPYYAREIIRFDLSSIPVNATVISANLYLYSNPTPINGDGIHANNGTDNAMLVQQITEPWYASSIITYSTVTAVTTTNQVQVPATNSPFLDLNLDVKDMVASMVSQNANYGFSLRLNNLVIYNDRDFVSSHNTAYPDKHPKIIITYKKP